MEEEQESGPRIGGQQGALLSASANGPGPGPGGRIGDQRGGSETPVREAVTAIRNSTTEGKGDTGNTAGGGDGEEEPRTGREHVEEGFSRGQWGTGNSNADGIGCKGAREVEVGAGVGPGGGSASIQGLYGNPGAKPMASETFSLPSQTLAPASAPTPAPAPASAPAPAPAPDPAPAAESWLPLPQSFHHNEAVLLSQSQLPRSHQDLDWTEVGAKVEGEAEK
ncbi:unnamed protein product, partial [Discosporangium mesarthrocarpum]